MRNIYLDVSNVSRADGGSSLASYAYISGEEAKDERLQQDFAYSRRVERIKATGNVLPDNAPPEYQDPQKWLNDIERVEDRADARPAKKIVLAFPKKIPPAKREEILRRWIEVNLTQQGYPATYAIHEDKAGNNPHAHIIVANRPLDKDGKWLAIKSKTTYKLDEYGERVPVLELDEQTGKPIPVLDEQGQQLKDKHGRLVYKQKEKTYKDGRARKQWHRTTITDNPLDKKETLQAMRVTWAYSLNKHLDQADRVDWRTFEAQGLDIAPQIHEGYAARQIEARGGMSWKCETNRQIRAGNEQLLAAKARLATVQRSKAASLARLDQLDQMEDNYYMVKPQPMPKTAQTGKAGGALGAVAGVAKGVAGEITSAPGKLIGVLGGPDGEGGLDEAIAQTAQSVVQSAVKLDPLGAGKSAAELPLAVLKNVESEDVQRDKMREAQQQAQAEQGLLLGGKSKSKSKGKDKGSKGKGQGPGEHAPLVRGPGR